MNRTKLLSKEGTRWLRYDIAIDSDFVHELFKRSVRDESMAKLLEKVQAEAYKRIRKIVFSSILSSLNLLFFSIAFKEIVSFSWLTQILYAIKD